MSGLPTPHVYRLAPSMAALTGWRAMQGLGGAGLMVVPRAIIRDQYTGTQATRLMAMLMLVISISPMLAPLAGSAVMALADNRRSPGCGAKTLRVPTR